MLIFNEKLKIFAIESFMIKLEMYQCSQFKEKEGNIGSKVSGAPFPSKSLNPIKCLGQHFPVHKALSPQNAHWKKATNCWGSTHCMVCSSLRDFQCMCVYESSGKICR